LSKKAHCFHKLASHILSSCSEQTDQGADDAIAKEFERAAEHTDQEDSLIDAAHSVAFSEQSDQEADKAMAKEIEKAAEQIVKERIYAPV
jgi:hypothetical protein